MAANDGWPERDRVHLLRDLTVLLKNALLFDPQRAGDLTPLLGNHVVLKMPEREVYALFAHARWDSVRVGKGQRVATGQQVAEVGHFGNSTAPHLHFQLMDAADIALARGLPCRFRAYEALHDGEWREVRDGVPGKRELVRYRAAPTSRS